MDFFDILLAKKLEDDRDPTIEGLSVTENGTYSEQGKAYSPVIVEVPEPTLISKSITANGTYSASADNADGYSSVTVEVPLPSNAHLATPVTSQPIANASAYPLPKCDVTVSNADKCEVIVTNDGQITEDSGPYLNRHSAGGNTELDEVIGGTVAWNQLTDFSKLPSADNITYTSDDGKSVTLNGSTTTAYARSGWYSLSENQSFAGKYGHKVLFLSKSISGTIDGTITFLIGGSAAHPINEGFVTPLPSSGQMRINVQISENSTLDNYKITFICIDLTQMFGTTIDNYIYSLEQATAGSGIAWLKSYGFLTEDYYPYNAGELMSVKTSGHIMRDGSNNIIGNYPLSPIELRGIPKLDANNKLYYDGDSYRCDGRVKRRYGIVDLGTLSWAKQSHATLGTYFYGNVASLGIKVTGDYYLNVANAICLNYTATRRFPEAFTNKTFCYDGTNTSVTQIQIKDDNYSDAATFKTAMSGVYLVYELATPTEEYTYSFGKNQTVDANGTEEYIDDRTVAIPVGHSTKYYHGKAYTKYFAENSGVVSMADEGIMPTNPMYINANGNIDAEYWA